MACLSRRVTSKQPTPLIKITFPVSAADGASFQHPRCEAKQNWPTKTKSIISSRFFSTNFSLFPQRPSGDFNSREPNLRNGREKSDVSSETSQVALK